MFLCCNECFPAITNFLHMSMTQVRDVRRFDIIGFACKPLQALRLSILKPLLT